MQERSVELDALMREVHATFETYVKLNKRIAPEILISVQTIEDPGQLADTIVGQLQLKLGRQAGDAGDGLAVQAAGAALRADQGRDRDPAGREEDPHTRQEADGEDAEGVLPQRADAGDPEGAGRSRRVQERDDRAGRPGQAEEPVERGAGQGQEGAEEAAHDGADVGRGGGRAQLPRLGAGAALGREDRGQAGRRARPSGSSTRTTTA